MNQPISRIHILDSHTANQIAAGEVVDRPVSVVKELVENAIDSGASGIFVRLYGCGCEKIKVIDNGCGMSPEDMRLAVQRHATSKIAKAEDLNQLHSLGFRGEALPSIASVSLLHITSKKKEQETAYHMQVEGGKASLPEECAGTDGTSVEVDQLFYNTPARKKFLKSPRTELGLISDYVGRMALCHRDIAFTLMNGNHRIIVTNGKGSLEAASIAVFGHQINRDLLEVSNEDKSIYGLLSLPVFTRSIRNNSFFVNGRLVRSKELSIAVDRAYHTLIPEKRYPFTVLFFELPPESIDVNVHPAKMEIRFHDPKPVQEALTGLIFSSLKKYIPQPTLRDTNPVSLFMRIPPERQKKPVSPKKEKPAEAAPASADIIPIHGETAPSGEKAAGGPARDVEGEPFGERGKASGMDLYKILKGDLRPLQSSPEKRPSSGTGSDGSHAEPTESTDNEKELERQASRAERRRKMEMEQQLRRGYSLNQELFFGLTGTPPRQERVKQEILRFSTLQPIGQFASTFILASSSDTLYIIDQHAAAERIQYEKILRAVENSKEESEMLAIPQPLELSYRESLLLTDYILEIRDLGFIIEHFGEQSYVIRGVPSWLGKTEPQQLIRDYLEYVQVRGKTTKAELRRQELFYMACRQALKGNRYLSNGDVSSLFLELDECRESNTCPHGRPIAIQFTIDDLFKHFLRGHI
ncbi:MAG: DNA mismatch repair endonuclease MutL [Bacillota bacterium]|nr:DNA mismatch repair endonuclease MutL [Bacillota bacterium]